MKLKFMGSTACIPDVHEDCPSFLVNEKYLFDCGWNVIGDLRETGCDVKSVRYVFFTHLHHDHYLGLATYLFYLIHSRCLPLDQLTLVGPEEDLERVMKRTADYLQMDRFYADRTMPKLLPWKPGDLLETDDVIIECARSKHPVAAFAYKITEKATGAVLCAGGDTAPIPEHVPFFAGADALIHEATLGASPSGNDPINRSCGHSTLFEAADMARQANVPVLFPVHMGVEALKSQKKEIIAPPRLIPPERGREYSILPGIIE